MGPRTKKKVRYSSNSVGMSDYHARLRGEDVKYERVSILKIIVRERKCVFNLYRKQTENLKRR